MTDRPILFNDAMVRAILSGAKTQTRRPVKRESAPSPGFVWAECLCGEIDPADRPCVTCEGRFGDPPYGVPGDRLWVRECFAVPPGSELREECAYRADFAPSETKTNGKTWTPSIHMPRWASRLTLRVTDVRVERLQDISERDATADLGASPITRDCKVTKFARLWDDIYGGWNLNPWVWVVSFEREVE